MRAKKIYENISFERGKDPIDSMKIGLNAQMEQKYGKKWKIFKRCNDISRVSYNFNWVSDIQFNEKDPYFNIESEFYYTDEEDFRYNLNYVIILDEEGIYAKEVVGKDEMDIRSVEDFVEFTEAFESREDWANLFLESANFERGLEPKRSLRIGKGVIPYKTGDIVAVWSPKKNGYVLGEVIEDEASDENGNPKITKLYSNVRDTQRVRRIWIRHKGEVKTANFPIDPANRYEDKWSINESANFERGKDPKESLQVGLRYKKDLKPKDEFLVWNRNNKDWDHMIAVNYAGPEYETTYEYPDLMVMAHKKDGSWILEATCIWIGRRKRWEYLSQYKMTESVEFQRGIDPKTAIGIGQRALIHKWFKTWAPRAKYTIDDNLNISVEGSLDLAESNVIELPDNLSVGGFLDLWGTPITKLPDNLSVRGALNLEGTPIAELPDNLSIGRINFQRTEITKLPNNLSVEGDLVLQGTNVTELSDNLSIGGSLYLGGTLITELPDNLSVGKNLYLQGTKITKLPKSLKVKGEIYKDF